MGGAEEVEALGRVVHPGEEAVGGRDGDGEAGRALDTALAAVALLWKMKLKIINILHL